MDKSNTPYFLYFKNHLPIYIFMIQLFTHTFSVIMLLSFCSLFNSVLESASTSDPESFRIITSKNLFCLCAPINLWQEVTLLKLGLNPSPQINYSHKNTEQAPPTLSLHHGSSFPGPVGIP